jgi:hypothetical protein
VHLIVIYANNHLVQVYEIEPTIQRVNTNFTWDQLFGPDEIVYGHYHFDEYDNTSKVIINQRENSRSIGAKYNVSIYSFDMTEDYVPIVHLLASKQVDRALTDSLLSRSSFANRDYVFIYQGLSGRIYDSIIYVSYLN